ncbi:glycosyltransferase family 2 protein [Dichotomicrobium thermohalophilum]|uniref:glycosyltransferase family 2 protein n=1 Tax=Dichotomicrobium thermohalophilum TaxID=933063 RepID=UPI001474081C|nr:glycosyltransferase [Dichotomicrobium thermohalophilum]
MRLTGAAGRVPPRHWLEARAPLPVRGEGVSGALNVEAMPAHVIDSLAHALGKRRAQVALLTRQNLIDLIIRHRGQALLRAATWRLRRLRPDQSAADGVALWQMLCLLAFTGLVTGAALISFRDTMTLLSAALSLVFLVTVLLRLIAAVQLAGRTWLLGRRPGPPSIADADLPRYTILVPLFREADVLPQLVANLRALDYPATKLDIKLILESVDKETIAAARAMDLPGTFDIIVVPDGRPRTKPKACNFALEFATGDFAVIYDAEDRPEPDQLRKAVEAFAQAPTEVVCLQAKLNFDNATENWLAKQFTIEYTSLFWGILPALDMLRLPIPLGGTSNHFRIEVLRELGAWDAFNVTEDADLGMRIYRAGYRCKVLDSTTWEEAACQPGNWLRQRTRWLKGWMQTYAVHMRQPERLRAELGLGGFWAFQGLFAAVVISTLAHPLFYILLAYDSVHGGFMRQAESVLGLHFWAIATFNLIAGYGAAIVLGVVSLRARGVANLLPQILLIPVYWLCISVAAYRALYQLVADPFYWEKTQHGVSNVPRKTA